MNPLLKTLLVSALDNLTNFLGEVRDALEDVNEDEEDEDAARASEDAAFGQIRLTLDDYCMVYGIDPEVRAFLATKVKENWTIPLHPLDIRDDIHDWKPRLKKRAERPVGRARNNPLPLPIFRKVEDPKAEDPHAPNASHKDSP